MPTSVFRLALIGVGICLLGLSTVFAVLRDNDASGQFLIVSSNFRDYDQALYLMSLDGTPLKRLTRIAGNESLVAVSPNGEWIIAQSQSNLLPYSIHVPTGNIRQMTPNRAFFITWSPDGAWAYFETSNSPWRSHAIFRVRADGSGYQELTDTVDDSRFGEWSPDGEWMYFESRRNDHTNLYRMRPDGRDEQQLTTLPDKDRFVAFSPNGEWLFFRNYRAGVQDLYRIRPDGTEQEMLLPGLLEISIAGWSPDQSQMLIESGSINQNAYYVADADGHNPRIVPIDRAGTFLGWTSDGEGMVFQISFGYPRWFQVVQIDRQLLIQQVIVEVPPDPQNYLSFNASFDGDRILYVINDRVRTTIFKIGQDGSDQQVVVQNVTFQNWYYYQLTETRSPDGKWMVIEDHDSSSKLYRINLQSLEREVVHTAAGNNNNWQMFQGWLEIDLENPSLMVPSILGLGVFIAGLGTPLTIKKLQHYRKTGD